MSTPTFRKHIVGHAFPAFLGHNKPLINLAILIAESRKDVAFTLLTGGLLYSKLMGELAKLPQDRYKAIEKQINVLNVISPERNPMEPPPEIVPAFKQLYTQTGSITCLTSQKTINCTDLPPPCVAILDVFAIYALRGIRSFASPEQVPIITWVSGTVGATMMLWGPERYGGRGNFAVCMEEEMKQGKEEFEAFESPSVCGVRDEVLQIPSYPPMYDYERLPSITPDITRVTHAGFMKNCLEVVLGSDGAITVSSRVFEDECVDACDEFFSSMGKTHHSIGPMLVIPTPQTGDSDADTDKVFSFLDQVKEEFGEKSVIYVCFGTTWYPEEQRVSAVIDQLIETKTPFIFAHPSPIVQPSEDLLKKISEYPHGLDLLWAPQEKILSHPATGWQVTHGGFNTIQESFMYKVPLILWPMVSDQPLNSALLSVKFEAAFELLEVRTGVEGKKPYRRRDEPTPKYTVESVKEEFGQVLKDLKGGKGATVRKNLEELSEKLEKVWDDDGYARKGLEAFLNKYVD